MKKESDIANNFVRNIKKTKEKLNNFYNIHGEADHMIKRCNRDYRISILLESGICVKCIMKALVIQFNFLEFLYKTILKEHNSKWTNNCFSQTNDCISKRENIKILNEHDIQVQKIVISSNEELKRLDHKEIKALNSCHICSKNAIIKYVK